MPPHSQDPGSWLQLGLVEQPGRDAPCHSPPPATLHGPSEGIAPASPKLGARPPSPSWFNTFTALRGSLQPPPSAGSPQHMQTLQIAGCHGSRADGEAPHLVPCSRQRCCFHNQIKAQLLHGANSAADFITLQIPQIYLLPGFCRQKPCDREQVNTHRGQDCPE